MKKNKLVKSLVLLTISLAACDPGHDITSTVENKSSRQVTLVSLEFAPDEIILEPGESKVVKHGGLGGYEMVNGSEFCPCEDPDIKIYPVDTLLAITKDIKNTDNWEKTRKRQFIKNGVFTCKFILTDEDIQ